MRHVAARPRRLMGVVLAALILAALSTGGGTLAQWQQRVSVDDLIAFGQPHFAVGDPTANGGPLAEPWSATWSLPAGVLGSASNPLAPGASVARAVQLDGVSPGNTTMSWQLEAVTIADPTGTGLLAGELRLIVYPIREVNDCAARSDPPADALYAGPLAAATIAAQPLDDSGDTLASRLVCLSFTLDPALPTSYANTATVTGQADDAGQATATASDSWHATIVRPAAQYTPDVTFQFASPTAREGSGS